MAAAPGEVAGESTKASGQSRDEQENEPDDDQHDPERQDRAPQDVRRVGRHRKLILTDPEPGAARREWMRRKAGRRMDRTLSAILKPRSIAVIGASRRETSIGPGI